jgi:hypothetical protein
LPQSVTFLGPELYDLFRSDNNDRKNVVVMLLTCDASGYPRVALLSPYQILAVDNKHLFVHVYRGSTSNKNLQEKKKATLVIVTPPSIRYVRISGASQSKNDDPDTDEELHELIVEEERTDYSPEAPITTPLLFDETKIKERYEKNFELMLQSAKSRSSMEKT